VKPHHLAPPAAEDVRESQLFVGILGGFQRTGIWTPARTSTVIVVFGGGVLDLREARLLPGVTGINVFACMGGLEIIVGPDIIVDCVGSGILGAFDQRPRPPESPAPDAPVLRVGGFAFFAGVVVDMRYPGESERDARKRQGAYAG
jgi:hypothetical protein